METGEKVAAFRRAAKANDAEAARELGRLMCLVPQDPEDDEQETEYEFEVTWPAEPWLRVAISGRSDDLLTKKLLAGVFVRQIAYWQMVREISPYVDDEEVAATNARRRVEAERLYSEVLEVDPEDREARAGLDKLIPTDVVLDHCPTDEGHSFYFVQHEMWGGSVPWSASS